MALLLITYSGEAYRWSSDKAFDRNEVSEFT